MNLESAVLINNYLKQEFSISDTNALQLTQEYIDNLEKIYDEALKTFEKGLWTDLERIGHSIKGTSANMGLIETAHIGKRLQDACINQNTEKYKTILKDLKSEIIFLKKTLKDIY